MWKNRSKLIFMTCTFIAGTILCQMAMYVLHLLLNWDLTFNLIQACHSAARSLGLSSVEYMLDALVFYTMFLAFWKITRQAFLSRKIFKKMVVYRHGELTHQINRKYNEGRHDFTVIDHSQPIALTMGFLSPHIVLSTGLLNLLDENELEAVIHHELFHKEHRDPLKTFLLSLFASVMWYIPILKWFYQKYKIVREVMADTHAINRLGTSADLGSALLKIIKRGNPANMSFSYVSFADTSVNYRIRHILDPLTEFPLKLPLTATLISIHVFLLLCTLFIVALT